jgi:hypothetical protein
MNAIVTPAKAGTHEHLRFSVRMDLRSRVPAFAGMTGKATVLA